eukprot:scaffold149_cov315-Pinguiococcus_pyrenoidosus.AAC.21
MECAQSSDVSQSFRRLSPEHAPLAQLHHYASRLRADATAASPQGKGKRRKAGRWRLRRGKPEVRASQKLMRGA